MSVIESRPTHPAPPEVLQVTGLCRFSYPTSDGSGFQKPHQLYSAKRLDQRLWLFASFCLPNLLAQTDQNFRLIILIGDNLPAFYRDALQELTAPHPNLIVHSAPELQPHIELCSKVLQSYRDPNVPYVAEFNMDDDDAVGRDFIAQLRRQFDAAHLLLNQTGHVEIDFCRGFAGLLGQGTLRVKHVLAPHWGLAQAFLMRSDNALTALSFHHSRYWKNNIALSLTREPMFLRIFHGGNDSHTSWERLKTEKLRPREGRSILQNMHRALDVNLTGWLLSEEA